VSSEFTVEQFPCLKDNIGILLHDKNRNAAIAIDAPDGGAVLAAASRLGAKLEAVLITHHHSDHTAGIAALKEAGAVIYGPKAEAAQIEGLDRLLEDKQQFAIGRFDFEVIATPGHTLGEISYFLPGERIAFTGDTLFSLGCGRIFEGNAPMMFRSLQKLTALPLKTKIYCGHEYSADNARFALTVEPNNTALQKRAQDIAALRAAGKFTLPAILADELVANPFLRADSPEIRQKLHMEKAKDEEVFAELRQMKDRF